MKPTEINMFNIRIVSGDAKTERMYYFVHKNYRNLTKEEQAVEFDKAVKELNHIYNDYGRFATSKAIIALFKKFDFEQTIP